QANRTLFFALCLFSDPGLPLSRRVPFTAWMLRSVVNATRELLMRLLVTATLLVAAFPSARLPGAEPYPQLIATCYPDRGKLPPHFAPPAAAHDCVEKAKLPADAKVLSAARAANGAVWVVTDRGALASRGDRYVRLEIGPRRPAPISRRSGQTSGWRPSPR